MILALLKEDWRQRQKARQALRYIYIPQAVHYLAADRINRPGKRRAYRWAKYGKQKKEAAQQKKKART